MENKSFAIGLHKVFEFNKVNVKLSNSQSNIFFSIDILLHIHLSNIKYYQQVQRYWECLGKL